MDRRSFVSADARDDDAASVQFAHNIIDAEKSLESLGLDQISNMYDPNLDAAEHEMEEDSPYPEVRSAVANVDDPTMPASTIRAWTLGLFWAIVLPGINQFYYYRYPNITVPSLVAQLITFPMGRAWAQLVPASWHIFGCALNPGPFSIKEHVLVTIMAGVGAPSAYATDIIATQRLIYLQHTPFAYKWLLVMSTQMIGFSIGGIAKRFLVSPPSMIWPNTLVQCALFNTLHSSAYVHAAGNGNANGNGSSGWKRERFFVCAFVGAAVWYLFPGYLFTALSTFSWVCWIVPDNVKVNQIFGYRSGFGFSVLTFDWTQITFIGSPLATPWWSEANVIAGFLLFYWFLAPLLYYLNVWDTQYLPVSSRDLYNNTGGIYDVSRILHADKTFDAAAYEAYSPPYLSVTFALSYGLSFAAITATLLHAAIFFVAPVRAQFRRSLREQPDIHARLMAVYAEVPEWWYACIFAVTFVFACVCVEVWPTQMPIWALVLALLIALFYIIPVGMLKATTNRDVGLNVITEMVIGYALPGRPIAMMMFKTWGYISVSQAISFTADFKLGHYMKVPPRPMFWAQVVSTAIAGTVQLAVQSWMFTNIPDLCQSDQHDQFSCPGTQVFATASIFWGAIGPRRLFSQGQVYYALLLGFLAGVLFPVGVWLLSRRWRKTFFYYVNFPVMFSGLGNIPPATAINYVPWALVGFIFQYIIRRRRYPFWAKYNYVLAAALDAGTAVATILVFFCLQYPLNGNIGLTTIQAWWGNTVYENTADWRKEPLRTLPAGRRYGPDAW